MKTIGYSSTLLAVLLAACGVHGDGHLTTETRYAEGFTAVESASAIRTVIHESDHFEVRVTVDGNLQQYVETRQSGDTLVLEDSEDIWDVADGAQITVFMPRVAAAGTVGSGDVELVDVTEPTDLTLIASGSGDLTFAGPATSLTALLDGSGDLSVMVVDVSPVLLARATSSGSGYLDLHVHSNTLVVDAHGSGGVRLEGAATTFDLTSTGSGSVRARGLAGQSGTITNSGSGRVTATADGGTVAVSILGSGDVELYGSSVVSVSRVGSGELVRH